MSPQYRPAVTRAIGLEAVAAGGRWPLGCQDPELGQTGSWACLSAQTLFPLGSQTTSPRDEMGRPTRANPRPELLTRSGPSMGGIAVSIHFAGRCVDRHHGRGRDRQPTRLICSLAVLTLALAGAGCASISPTPSVGPSGVGETQPQAPTVAPSGALGKTQSKSLVTQPSQPGFATTGSMVSPSRGLQTATLLTDGRVMVVGGQTVTAGSVSYFSSGELYDPATGAFTATGSMHDARESHTATLLQDGRVLIVGGQNDQVLASAELYDPKTGKFSPTGAMAKPRENQTATLLTDGRVLVAGGNGTGGDAAPLATAEIYDPKTGAFSSTGSMSTARLRAGATRLSDGRVLIVGGEDANLSPIFSAEIYDPRSGLFSPTGSMSAGAFSVAAISMLDGRVFVVGAGAGTTATAEIYDPTNGSFSVTGRMAVPHPDAAVLLDDGRVLVIGGYWAGDAGSATADLYDPTTNTFGPGGTLVSPRLDESATVMADGRVLLAGGVDDASAEVYTPPAPGAGITPAPSPTPNLPEEIAGLPVTNLQANQIGRSPTVLTTAFGSLVYGIASKGSTAEVTVSNLSTGSARVADVGLPADETIGDPLGLTQPYAATDGRYLVVYATHSSDPQPGRIAIGGCTPSGGDWQLLVAPLDPTTGLPSSDFTVFASGVTKRVFNAPLGGEGGNCWYENTVFAVDSGMIAYTVDDVSSSRPMGSRILLRSLADGSTLRSVVATEMVYEVRVAGTTIAWGESQNISVTDQPAQGEIRVSTATHPTPLDIASGPVSPSGGDGRQLPALRLVGDEISWEGLGNTSVWYQKIGEGSPLRLTPVDLICQLAGSTPGHVAVSCSWSETSGATEPAVLVVATIGAGLSRVAGVPADAMLRPVVSNGWFVDSGGQVAYQPVTNTYGAPLSALGM